MSMDLTRRERVLYMSTSLTGLAVWLGVSWFSGSAEAWNSDLYFMGGILIMMSVSCVAGYVEPQSAWRWGVSVVILQPLALLAMSTPGPFIIAGLFFFAVFTLFCMGSAVLGSVFRAYRMQNGRSDTQESNLNKFSAS
jgi:hypothetical protein